MSRLSAYSWLDMNLRRLLRSERAPRIAILGIGHTLRGDDGAGVAVARALKPILARNPHVLVIEAGPVPENAVGPLRRFAPDLILMIDAAQLNTPAGSVRIVPWQDATGMTASTHTLPLSVLGRYLEVELGCKVALLGVQPALTTVGSSLSAPVRRAVNEIVRVLNASL